MSLQHECKLSGGSANGRTEKWPACQDVKRIQTFSSSGSSDAKVRVASVHMRLEGTHAHTSCVAGGPVENPEFADPSAADQPSPHKGSFSPRRYSALLDMRHGWR